MLLSDADILDEIEYRRNIIMEPYDPRCLQPASYDVHLDSKLLLPYSDFKGEKFDIGAEPQQLFEHTLMPHESEHHYYLPPGGVALGCTVESLTIHPNAPIAADITGCSSLGRWFLAVHVTAGFIDPNWSGQLTLEIVNLSPWSLRLWSGMRIGQIRFYRMSRPSSKKYGQVGHYYGSVGPVGSKYTP